MSWNPARVTEVVIAVCAVCTFMVSTVAAVFGLRNHGKIQALSVSVDGRLTQLLEERYNLGAAEQAASPNPRVVTKAAPETL